MIKNSLTILLLISSILFAQQDSSYHFTLPELKVSITKPDKTDTYLFSREANEFDLTSASLIADTSRYKWSYKIDDVKSIQFRNGVSTWGGAFYGGCITGGIGLVFGLLSSLTYQAKPVEIALGIPGFAAAGFVAGAFIGGFLGSFIPAFDTYDKFSTDINLKKEQLRIILYKHDLNKKK